MGGWSRTCARVVALGVASTLSGWGAAAGAQEGDVAVALTYAAPSACPTAGEFLTEVSLRSSRVHDAADAGPVYRVTVRVTDEGGRLAGVLTLVDLEGHSSSRTIKGSSCADISRALALVVALDVAGVATAPPAPPPSPPPPSPPSPPPEPSPPELIPEPPKPPAAPWSPALAALFGVRSGVAPEIAPAATLALEIARRAVTWGLSLRVAASYATRTTAGDGDDVVFRLAAMTLDGCLARSRAIASILDVSACARMEAGVHLGEITPRGRGLSGAPWLAPGVAGRMRAHVTEEFFVDAEAFLVVPLERRRFLEGTKITPIFETPAVAAGGGLGAGLAFP